MEASYKLSTLVISIIIYIELETFYRNAFSFTLRFENEYAETNIPIVPWQQCGGETIGRIKVNIDKSHGEVSLMEQCFLAYKVFEKKPFFFNFLGKK